jgi:DNA-3-methyladenine glycosylase
MWAEPGTAYVYLVYGMYDCLNVVTEPPGRPAAVLVRAVEPLAGTDLMRVGRIDAVARRRRWSDAALDAERARLAALPEAYLARGPGLVAAAFGIDRRLTGVDLLAQASPVRLEPGASGDRPPEPAWTPRVGIAYAGAPWTEAPWRLIDAASPSVSGPRLPGRRPAARPDGSRRRRRPS